MNGQAWLGSLKELKGNEELSLDGVYPPVSKSVEMRLIRATVVEINLRLPSMLHGKKGFDRIVYAFKNVLTKPVTWLFHNLREGMLTSTSPARLATN